MALPYLGLGSVLFNSNEYENAAKAFYKGKEIREQTIGYDQADTATCYNNYASCLLKLGRYHEALDYFKLAEAILAAELGNFHERTLVVIFSLKILGKKKQT